MPYNASQSPWANFQSFMAQLSQQQQPPQVGAIAPGEAGPAPAQPFSWGQPGQPGGVTPFASQYSFGMPQSNSVFGMPQGNTPGGYASMSAYGNEGGVEGAPSSRPGYGGSGEARLFDRAPGALQAAVRTSAEGAYNQALDPIQQMVGNIAGFRSENNAPRQRDRGILGSRNWQMLK